MCSSQRLPTILASSGLEWYTAFLPSSRIVQIPTVKPNAWKNGRTPRADTASGSSRRCWLIWWTLFRMLPWVSTTPLGSPVDPEVNITVAVASGRSPRSPARNEPSAATGTTRAVAAAQPLSSLPTFAGISSRWINVPLGVSLTFSITFRDVITWRIPHWSTEASITPWLAE